MRGYQLFFIAYPLLDLLLDYMEGKYGLKISEAEEMSESLIYRMRYAKYRLCFSCVILLTAFISMLIIDGIDGAKMCPFLVGWIYVKQRRMSKHQNPVSWRTLNDVRDSEFILYLRGFSSDTYKDARSLESNNTNKFCEKKCIDVLSLYYPVYAVGMTKELYAPHGAKRIYLKDETWESDVMDLIKRAKMVMVYLNDSVSCIREIHHCSSFTDKTLYIIDDIAKFRSVRDYCRKNNLHNALPLIIPSAGTYAAFQEGGNRVNIMIENTTKSYCNIIARFASISLGWNRWVYDFGKIWTVSMIFAIMLFPVLSVILAFPRPINYIFYFGWIICAITMTFHYVPYKYTRKIWQHIPRNLYATSGTE